MAFCRELDFETKDLVMQMTNGVLLVNLGTPDSPAPRDVYRYLIEFLTDARVIDMPWLKRQLLVRGVIVPARYRQSAKSYQAIWTPEGSPLKVYGYRVKEALQSQLGDDFHVELAMRYQNPSIAQVLAKFKAMPLKRLIVIPFFPQYASATTGSVHQRVMEEVSRWDNIPKITFINDYATHPAVIQAFCEVSAPYLKADYDHVLFSFHGLPKRQLAQADRYNRCCQVKDCCAKLSPLNYGCYSAQCYATAQAIVDALHIAPDHFSIAFQSRLGKEPWLQPYTSEAITALARQGKKRLLVFCPSFVCDCLETIHEIGVEYAEEFKHAGGEQLDLVPGLNDHSQWISALKSLVEEHLEKDYASACATKAAVTFASSCR